jgi:hypothetical protein
MKQRSKDLWFGLGLITCLLILFCAFIYFVIVAGTSSYAEEYTSIANAVVME